MGLRKMRCLFRAIRGPYLKQRDRSRSGLWRREACTDSLDSIEVPPTSGVVVELVTQDVISADGSWACSIVPCLRTGRNNSWSQCRAFEIGKSVAQIIHQLIFPILLLSMKQPVMPHTVGSTNSTAISFYLGIDFVDTLVDQLIVLVVWMVLKRML